MDNLFIFYRLISERVALSILCQILLSSQWKVVYELQLHVHMYVIVVQCSNYVYTTGESLGELYANNV